MEVELNAEKEILKLNNKLELRRLSLDKLRIDDKITIVRDSDNSDDCRTHRMVVSKYAVHLNFAINQMTMNKKNIFPPLSDRSACFIVISMVTVPKKSLISSRRKY